MWGFWLMANSLPSTCCMVRWSCVLKIQTLFKKYIFYESSISHKNGVYFFTNCDKKYSPLGASWSDLCCPQKRSLSPSFQFPTRPLFAFHTFWKFPKFVPYLKTNYKNSRSRLQIRWPTWCSGHIFKIYTDIDTFIFSMLNDIIIFFFIMVIEIVKEKRPNLSLRARTQAVLRGA